MNRNAEDADPIDLLAKEAGVELVRMGGEAFVRIADAPKLLDLALLHGIGVLGIEGFGLDRQWLIPDIGSVVSFESITGADSTRRRTEAARAVVKDLASEVDLVCISFE